MSDRRRGFLCRIGFHNWREASVGLTGVSYECKNCDAAGFSHVIDEGDIFEVRRNNSDTRKAVRGE